jgi:hypothetical protein
MHSPTIIFTAPSQIIQRCCNDLTTLPQQKLDEQQIPACYKKIIEVGLNSCNIEIMETKHMETT